MKGSSGARLEYAGDFIIKSCSDATEQDMWFKLASKLPVVDGVRIPQSEIVSHNTYKIEFINGVCGTHSPSTLNIDTLTNQILTWKNCPQSRDISWRSYMDRLWHNHILHPNSGDVVKIVFDYINDNLTNLPPSFSHGDLTLENVIIDNDGRLVIIDPNFKKDLFQSYLLDFGKLLQSVNSDYHRVFNSNPGVDLSAHKNLLFNQLRKMGILRECLLCEMSHIIRLRKYKSSEMANDVDVLLTRLLREIKFV